MATIIIWLTLFWNIINSQPTCDNSTFPLVQNEQAIGLYTAPTPAQNFNECEQICCNITSCVMFQWCGNNSTETCTPKNSCMIGYSNNFLEGQTGWNGRSKRQTVPIFGFTNVHGNHMVLQQAPNKAQVYGTSPVINDTVTIKLYDAQNNVIDSQITTVNATYSWVVQLSPQPASINGEEYTIIAESSNGTAKLTNILYGDVYICSGQSNMQFTVDSAFNASQSLSEANNYPLIRLLSVSQRGAGTPQYQVLSFKQEWSVASNISVGGGNWSYFSAMCWFYGKNLFDELQYPIGLIGTNYGGTPVRDWMSSGAKALCPNETIVKHTFKKDDYKSDITKYGKGYDFGTGVESAPNGNLWNAMICPFLAMTIKGAIWYQGESDCNYLYGASYACAFPAMINDWRAKWKFYSDTNGDFPFGFIHLSTWGDSSNHTCQVNSTCEDVAIVRHGQTANYGYVPNPMMINTFLATAIDLGDPGSPWGDIHPRYKQQAAKRLSNAALNIIYGKSEVYWLGPIADMAKQMDAKTIMVNFRNVNEIGLMLNRFIGFEVYDDSVSKWMYINATGDNVLLNGLFNVNVNFGNNNIVKPTRIRYNWYQAPCMPKEGIYGCSVYDKQEMLPALPFILDIST